MCPEPCFKRFHIMQDYYFDDSRYGRSRRLKEGGGRPFHRGRRRSFAKLKAVRVSHIIFNESVKITYQIDKLT